MLDVLSFPEEELNELIASHAAIMDLLKKHGLTDLTDHDAFFDLFYDEDLRFDYMQAFKKLTRCLNLVFPARQALDYMADYQALTEINVLAGKYFRDERLSMKGIPPKLRSITDTYLESKGIEVKVEPISILDDYFQKQVGKRKSSRPEWLKQKERPLASTLASTIKNADSQHLLSFLFVLTRSGRMESIMIEKEFEKYLAWHVKQIAREEKELWQLTRQANKRARLITEMLVKKYGVSKVFIFGSLAREDFECDSDIDLAVSGLPEELYWEAFGLAEELATPIKVDLVLLETAEPSLREYAIKEGKQLYDVQREKDRSFKKTGGGNT